MLISILGFWDIYFNSDTPPLLHHHLHFLTAFMWMGLLLVQLRLIDRGDFKGHRKVGLAVLLAGPIMVAMTATLSVLSAYKGVVSGKGDFLIIQNVMGSLEFAALVLFAFMFKRNRKLHGAFLMSTTIVFMGIGLFFALISFAPPFRIEGPETAYRFQTAAMTGQVICLLVGGLFFVRDYRTGWPYLLAAAFFVLNEVIRSVLTAVDLIDPLTRFVGSLSQPVTFVATFSVMVVLLAALALPETRKG